MERPIKELLIIMRDNIGLFCKKKCVGLCDLTDILKDTGIISDAEESIIDRYVYNNAPKMYNVPTIYYINDALSSFNWPKYELQPRLEWLNEQINLL